VNAVPVSHDSLCEITALRLFDADRFRPFRCDGGRGRLAGTAASIHLARAGFKVLCIEAEVDPSNPVGESLDWSAPALLSELGLPMENLSRTEPRPTNAM